MPKQNILTIDGSKQIALDTPKGSMYGFTWDGEKLTHRGNGKSVRFSSEVTAEIIAAVAQYEKGTLEVCRAWDTQAPVGWQFERVIEDHSDTMGKRLCEYSRYHKGSNSVQVRFAKEDLI